MRTYIRARLKGGCYFFTVNLAKRRGNDLLIRNIEHLRAAFRYKRHDHPFTIGAVVILPDHLLKHGYVDAPEDWPYSSFRRHLARGVYPLDWAAPLETRPLDLERTLRRVSFLNPTYELATEIQGTLTEYNR